MTEDKTGLLLLYIVSKCPSVWPSLNANITIQMQFGT